MINRILLFMFVFSFVLGQVWPDQFGSVFSEMMHGKASIDTLKEAFVTLLGPGLLVVAAAGLLGFPNQYLIFAGIATFLLGFFTFPIQIFQNQMLPDTIKVFFGGFFSLAYLLGLLNWFKGQSDA